MCMHAFYIMATAVFNRRERSSYLLLHMMFEQTSHEPRGQFILKLIRNFRQCVLNSVHTYHYYSLRIYTSPKCLPATYVFIDFLRSNNHCNNSISIPE